MFSLKLIARLENQYIKTVERLISAEIINQLKLITIQAIIIFGNNFFQLKLLSDLKK